MRINVYAYSCYVLAISTTIVLHFMFLYFISDDAMFQLVYEGRIAGFCALCAIQKHVSRALQSTGRILAPNDLVSNLRCILFVYHVIDYFDIQLRRMRYFPVNPYPTEIS